MMDLGCDLFGRCNACGQQITTAGCAMPNCSSRRMNHGGVLTAPTTLVPPIVIHSPFIIDNPTRCP